MEQIKRIYKEAAESNTRLVALLNTLNSYVSDKSLDSFFSFRADENNALSLSCEIEKIVDEESLQMFLCLDRSSMIDYIIFNAI